VGAQKIIVFISDGLPADYGSDTEAERARAASESIAKAAEFKAAGIIIYTVGIDIDQPFNPVLSRMSGPLGSGMYASASDPVTLGIVMRNIAASAVCH
jgi:hypothetical protein